MLPSIGADLLLQGSVLGELSCSAVRQGCIGGVEELHQDNHGGGFVQGGKGWECSDRRSGVHYHNIRFGGLGLGASESLWEAPGGHSMGVSFCIRVYIGVGCLSEEVGDFVHRVTVAAAYHGMGVTLHATPEGMC
jgi:hypothetical protein